MNTRNAFGSKPNSVAPVSIADAKHDAEATLRLIANLPSPEGLENRVIAGLRSAPRSSACFQLAGGTQSRGQLVTHSSGGGNCLCHCWRRVGCVLARSTE